MVAATQARSRKRSGYAGKADGLRSRPVLSCSETERSLVRIQPASQSLKIRPQVQPSERRARQSIICLVTIPSVQPAWPVSATLHIIASVKSHPGRFWRPTRIITQAVALTAGARVGRYEVTTQIVEGCNRLGQQFKVPSWTTR